MAERNYNELDGDQKFLLSIWAIIAIAVILLIVSITVNSIVYKSIVANHTNPVEYTCALDMPGAAVNPTCVMYWQQKGN